MTSELKAGAVLAAFLVVTGIGLALASGGEKEDPEGARMTLQRSVSPTRLGEVLVSVSGKAELEPGATDVTLRCEDQHGRLVTAARHSWPLEKDGQDPVPHIHQPASPRELEQIVRCRLGTRPQLTAALPLR